MDLQQLRHHKRLEQSFALNKHRDALSDMSHSQNCHCMCGLREGTYMLVHKAAAIATAANIASAAAADPSRNWNLKTCQNVTN